MSDKDRQKKSKKRLVVKRETLRDLTASPKSGRAAEVKGGGSGCKPAGSGGTSTA